MTKFTLYLRRIVTVILLLIFTVSILMIIIANISLDSGIKIDNEKSIDQEGYFSSKDNNYIYQYGRYSTKEDMISNVVYIHKSDNNGKLIKKTIIKTDDEYKFTWVQMMFEEDDGLYCVVSYSKDDLQKTKEYVYKFDKDLNILEKTLLNIDLPGSRIISEYNKNLILSVNANEQNTKMNDNQQYINKQDFYFVDLNSKIINKFRIEQKSSSNINFMGIYNNNYYFHTSSTIICFDMNGNMLWEKGKKDSEFCDSVELNGKIYIAGFNQKYIDGNRLYTHIPAIFIYDYDCNLLKEISINKEIILTWHMRIKTFNNKIYVCGLYDFADKSLLPECISNKETIEGTNINFDLCSEIRCRFLPPIYRDNGIIVPICESMNNSDYKVIKKLDKVEDYNKYLWFLRNTQEIKDKYFYYIVLPFIFAMVLSYDIISKITAKFNLKFSRKKEKIPGEPGNDESTRFY